jgi:predicted dehydrogenase
VEFREHWGGIFRAHPWLSGPADSYLGYTAAGGGASGEHSHALNFWQHLAHVAGAGRVVQVQAMLDHVSDGATLYDRLCCLTLRTERGLVGRVVQDVVTSPARKTASLQGTTGTLEWVNGFEPNVDAVVLTRVGASPSVFRFPKSRADDFVEELRHIDAVVSSPGSHSPIGLEFGLDTMLVLAAAHRSDREGHTVAIEYARGYTLEALGRASLQAVVA